MKMKRWFVCLCLAVCAALLFVSTAFAAGEARNSEGAAAIRITEQRSADNTYSFQVNLTAAEMRGAVFVAVYTQNSQMKYLEEHAATGTVSVTLRNILNTDRIKVMWLDESSMPLAQSDVPRTVEVTAKNHEEFANAVLNMMQDHDTKVIAGSENEYAFARLIIRSSDALPDLGAYPVVQRVSDTEGHTVLQLQNPDDAKACAKYLESHISSDGYVMPDTWESVQGQTENGSGDSNADSSHFSWGVPVIQADSYAANLSKRGVNRQITVAVVDTGVDYTHPFLKGRTISGYDFVDGDNDPMDEYYHGTHVAGTVVDCTPGLTNIKIMPVRVLGASGIGTTLNVGLGIQYAADHGANIINLSLGGTHNFYKEEAIDYAMSKNIVVVVSAGNNGGNAKNYCPSHIANCITVSAVDKNLQPANFSNYGTVVDLGAPGVDIKSCVPGGGYRELNGTSMASPHVAACAAMLLAESDSLTPAQVEKKLVEMAKVPSGWNKNYGAGIVNMESAAPTGFYALLYTDGEMVFQRSAAPASGKTLRHDPYPISAVAGGSGAYAAWHEQCESIERVTFAEEVNPVSTALWFYGCKNLKSVQNVKNLDTSNVADMSQMFAWCDGLETLDLKGLDTGNVTNMRQMFFQCGSLKTILVSDTFSVAKVTDSGDMFTGCVSLEGEKGTKYSGNYVSKAYARIDKGLENPGYFSANLPDLNHDPSEILYAVLYSDGELRFQSGPNAESGKTLVKSYTTDSGGYDDKVENYIAWYEERLQIRSVNFGVAIYPTSTALWFYDCKNLSSVKNPGNLHTNHVTDMSQMFAYCSSLVMLNLYGFNTDKVADTSMMFYRCEKLATIYASGSFKTETIRNSNLMFGDCVALKGGAGTSYSATHADKTYARIDSTLQAGYFTAK